MQNFVVLFNDTEQLHASLEAAGAFSQQQVVWHLVYAASNRPARLKRWVSRGGWERLAQERARKLSQSSADRLRRGLDVELRLYGYAGDVWQQAQQLAHEVRAVRLLDARAARLDEAASEPMQAAVHEPMVLKTPIVTTLVRKRLLFGA